MLSNNIKKILFFTSVFILIWIHAVIFNNADWDLFARLSVGKIFSQLGIVLKHDIFSYGIKNPFWIDHEWGSGVVFYFLQSHFGDAGLMLFKIFSTFIIFILISKIIELNNKKPCAHLNIIFYFLIIYGTFNGLGSNVRCQAFTFMFFTTWLYVLERVRRGEDRLLWIIPATALIWANLHGGFVSGLGLVGLYGIGEFLNKKPYKKYFLTLIPAVLITLINPYGFKYWVYIIQATTMPRPTIAEWIPTNFIQDFYVDKGFKIFLIPIIIGFITSIIYSIKKLKYTYKDFDKVKYILLILTFYMAARYVKHQTLFAIIASCFLYHDFYLSLDLLKNFIISKTHPIMEKIISNTEKIKDFIVYTIIIVIGLFMVRFNPVKIAMDGYPMGAVEFIKTNELKGNVLTLFHWGSYVYYKLYPNCYIAIDGRYEEVYPDSLHMKIFNFFNQTTPEWYDFLREYHTDILILPKQRNQSYNGILQAKDKWKLIYNDKTCGVFVPVSQAKNHYKTPNLSVKHLEKTKYNTDINFSGR